MLLYTRKGVLAMNRVFIRPIPLPQTVEGTIVEDENGDYNIYINSNIPSNRVRDTIIHELKHGAHGHLHNEVWDISKKEADANSDNTERPR